MARRAFKKMKKTVAILTVTSMLMGITITVMPSMNASAMEVAVQNKRNVMYYGDWSIWGGENNFYPKDIPADQLTHLNLAFLDFNASGDLIFCDKDANIGAPVGMPSVQWGGANAGIINALQDLRAENPNMKIGTSIGGWSKSGDFSTVTADPTIRAKFVENVMKFVEYTNMDFVDIDWEYPGDARQPDKVDNKNDEGTPNATAADKENYIKLLQDLRTALDKQGKRLGKPYELSVALPVSKKKLDLGIDINKLFSIVDFANIMTYDMYGGWNENSGHHAALYPNPNDPSKGEGLSVDESIDYIISKGAKKEKIVVGAAYYTRGWEKVAAGPDKNNPGLYGKAEKINKNADGTLTTGGKNQAPIKLGDGGRAGGVWAYSGLEKLKGAYSGLKEYWDDTAKAPYLYNEKTGAFFTYDNIRSIGEKTKYVNDNNLGGMIGWMASQDKSTTSTKRDELTKASKIGLYGQANLPDNKIVYTDLDISCSIKTSKDDWAKGGKYEITIKNNEKLEESGDTLRGVENAAETIKTPKFYIKNTSGTLTAGNNLAGKVTQEGIYTVVDISGVYEGAVIEPGKSYTFVLNTTNAKPMDTDISSIELAQHIYKGGTELNRQLIK
ncbi:glycosyl hydrolase family 18 protein [Clostridium gasigenes]|uniref:glycosyl hydrolase family 18 protein n=1 Tax=Clostridium gasigenes TaxID=94869 RepID=UPI0014383BDD|nr:glycosyl hydrolase family 18 protein [Clostridium gasigenes]NKF05918.1 chitinase [Clostridium gasigenes]